MHRAVLQSTLGAINPLPVSGVGAGDAVYPWSHSVRSLRGVVEPLPLSGVGEGDAGERGKPRAQDVNAKRVRVPGDWHTRLRGLACQFFFRARILPDRFFLRTYLACPFFVHVYCLTVFLLRTYIVCPFFFLHAYCLPLFLLLSRDNEWSGRRSPGGGIHAVGFLDPRFYIKKLSTFWQRSLLHSMFFTSNIRKFV